MSDGIFKNRPISKFAPGHPSDPSKGDMSGRKNTEHRQFGDGKDFNHKGKITNTEGSDYHDIGRPNAGLYGNFDEKDKSIAYLKERGQKGQEVNHYSATHAGKRIYTGAGPSAYNANPDYETYTPATSHGAASNKAVIRPTVERNENPPLVRQDGETKQLKKK